jgi:hypothetical protein
MILFHRPLPKRCRPVSEHTAFQSRQVIASGVRQVLRITRPGNPRSSALSLLPPFALQPAFPITLGGRYSSDSYGGSVTICLAAGR